MHPPPEIVHPPPPPFCLAFRDTLGRWGGPWKVGALDTHSRLVLGESGGPRLSRGNHFRVGERKGGGQSAAPPPTGRAPSSRTASSPSQREAHPQLRARSPQTRLDPAPTLRSASDSVTPALCPLGLPNPEPHPRPRPRPPSSTPRTRPPVLSPAPSPLVPEPTPLVFPEPTPHGPPAPPHAPLRTEPALPGPPDQVPPDPGVRSGTLGGAVPPPARTAGTLATPGWGLAPRAQRRPAGLGASQRLIAGEGARPGGLRGVGVGAQAAREQAGG